MKKLSLVLAPLLLIGCANQNAAVSEVADDATILGAKLEQCVLDCETIHAGQVRACVRRPVTEGRGGMMFNDCVGESYTTLGACYSGCDAQE